VLCEGRIVQRGCHAQLLAVDGLYRQLWNEQMSTRRSTGVRVMSVLSPLRHLPDQARRVLRGALGWMLLAAVLDGLAGLALVPLILAWFDQQSVQPSVLLLLGLTLLQALVSYVAQRRGYLAGAGLAAGLVSQLVQQLPRLPLARQGQLEDLVRGPVFNSMGIPAHLLAPLVTALVTPTMVVLGLIFIEPRLALALALAYLPLFALLRWAGRRSLALEQLRQQVDRRAGQLLQTFAQQQALIRSAGDASQGQLALRQALHEQHQATHRLNRRALPSGLGFAAAVQVVFSLVLAGGVLAVAAGQLSGALLVAVLVLLVRFIEPLSQLAYLDQALRMAWQALSQVLAVLTMPTLHSPYPGEQPQDASLQGQGLNICGEGGEQLLKDVDIHCAPGTFTAIVGPSGAGIKYSAGLAGAWHGPADRRSTTRPGGHSPAKRTHLGQPPHASVPEQRTVCRQPAVECQHGPAASHACATATRRQGCCIG
jgi:ATP-binding cassette subfamily B protein